MALQIKRKKTSLFIIAVFLILMAMVFYWISNKNMLVIRNDSFNTISNLKIHINDSSLHISDTVVIENITPGEVRKIKMNSDLLENSSGSWGYQYEIQGNHEIAIRHFSREHAITYSNKLEFQFSNSEILVLEGALFPYGKPDIL